ncbi:MAG: cytochrome c [Gammaproteobacteria bacterium]|nr:cytochrome c [Gammaproteobacteria bacterium]
MPLAWGIVLWSLTATAAVAAGESVYLQACMACHGADGAGLMPGVPDLTEPQGPLNKSDAELMKNIIGGFQSPGSDMAMPPKGGNPGLSNEDIEAVIRYMREAFGRR